MEEYQYAVHFKAGTNNTDDNVLSRIHQVVTRSQQTAQSAEPSRTLTNSSSQSEHSEAPELPNSQQTSHVEKESEHKLPSEPLDYQQYLSADKCSKILSTIIKKVKETYVIQILIPFWHILFQQILT